MLVFEIPSLNIEKTLYNTKSDVYFYSYFCNYLENGKLSRQCKFQKTVGQERTKKSFEKAIQIF